MEVALCSEVIHILPETNKCAHDTNEQMPRTMQSTYLDAHTRTSHPFGKRQACSHSQRQSSTQANHRSRPGTAVPLRTTEITYPPEAETVCSSLKGSQDPGPPPLQEYISPLTRLRPVTQMPSPEPVILQSAETIQCPGSMTVMSKLSPAMRPTASPETTSKNDTTKCPFKVRDTEVGLLAA